MGGEFMVLGFLAFTIWCCGQLGIFDEMANITASDMTLPSQGCSGAADRAGFEELGQRRGGVAGGDVVALDRQAQ